MRVAFLEKLNPMMHFKFLVVPLLLSAFLSAMAADREPTRIVNKTLVMEMVIPYVVEKIDVPLQTSVPVAFQTPEQAVQAHFSSMWAADWNTFLSTWGYAGARCLRRRGKNQAT
jgi:hypothetical protein